MTRSPTPFSFSYSTGLIKDKKGNIIGQVMGLSRLDFDFIEQAINSHDALLESLKEAKQNDEDFYDFIKETKSCDEYNTWNAERKAKMNEFETK